MLCYLAHNMIADYPGMILSYFKLAIRNLLKNSTFSLITIVGLAIGLATGILILAYVVHERSYDTFYDNASQKYRIITKAVIENEQVTSAGTMAPLGPAIAEEITQIKDYVRIYKSPRSVVKFANQIFYEDKILYADKNFHTFFNFPLKPGSESDCLKKKNKVLITPESAKKYFGDTNPIGRPIQINGASYEVCGVFEELPSNSHLDFNFVCSFPSLEDEPDAFLDQWLSLIIFTYVELYENTSVDDANKALNNVVNEKTGKQAAVYGIKVNLELQPVAEIHLQNITDQKKPADQRNKLWIFSTVAIFIILIACINFMTLTTARAYTRAKEIGVKKIVGANRNMLISQFLTESIVISFISLFLALAIIEFLLPLFNTLFYKELSIEYFTEWHVSAGLFVLTVLVGVFAGSYPSFYLSGLTPFRVLKGVHRPGRKAKRFRSFLVIIQFIISISLICNTLIIYQQLNFLDQKELGFKKENMLIVNLNEVVHLQEVSEIKTILSEARGVKNITALSSYPGNLKVKTPFTVEDSDTTPSVIAYYFIDKDFLNTFNIKLKTGRNFTGSWGTDSASVLINERFAKEFGWENPVGKIISLPDYPERKGVDLKVIGVVNDFHINALHVAIEPLVMSQAESFEYLAIELPADKTTEALADIAQIWKDQKPETPLDFNFLDKEFKNNYREDRQLAGIFLFFAIIAIFIACLGLYGLGAFSTVRRTKEIGIRKVLGASTSKIAALLSEEFIKLIMLAMVVAWPFSYLIMDQWLKKFAYRIDIPFWIFGVSGIITILISLITIQYHTIKTANANPVDSLRYE